MVESHTLEYKQSWRDEALKSICAFANTVGGTLMIGMDDLGYPIGAKEAKKLLETIPGQVRQKLGIIPQVRLETIDGRSVIRVDVAYSPQPISVDGRFYLRSGSTNQELHGHVLALFLMDRSGQSWVDFPETRATLDDISLETIDRFRTWSSDRQPDIVRENDLLLLLQKLNLTVNGQLRRAAILLFGKETKRFYPQVEVKIGRFASEVDIAGSDIIEGNLFMQVERAMDILRNKYIQVALKVEGLRHHEEWVYPRPALREALINAIIHRDYNAPASIQMKIYDDRIWLWNPGGLPPGISIADLSVGHSSFPRNRLLADIFYKASFIESWGRGTTMMIDRFLEAGLTAPEFREQSGGLVMTFTKLNAVITDFPEVNLSDSQTRVLEWVEKHGSITNREYCQMLKVSDATATRELTKMVILGVLRKIGSRGKGTHYLIPDENNKD